jgi:hypothetical protein
LEEPLLNPDISRCFRVPDAAADSFLAADLNAESARQYAARVWTYHEVVKLLDDGHRVVGALCHDLVKDEEVTIHAGMIVNAAGAWSGKIAATVGLHVRILPSKGTMIAINHRVLNTVVNRCKMPSDGDIIVPAHTVAVIGTTDEKVSDPEQFAIEPWEIRLMLDEGEKLIPNLKHMRILRAWAGVRPLYQETEVTDLRDATRAYALLDHETRDGVAGIITITGGKWTTYRLMAQATVDRVCEKLGVQRECRTHLEPLPDGEKATYHHLGAPLARVGRAYAYKVSSQKVGANPCGCPPGQVHPQVPFGEDLPLPQDTEKIQLVYRGARRLKIGRLATITASPFGKPNSLSSSISRKVVRYARRRPSTTAEIWVSARTSPTYPSCNNWAATSTGVSWTPNASATIASCLPKAWSESCNPPPRVRECAVRTLSESDSRRSQR